MKNNTDKKCPFYKVTTEYAGYDYGDEPVFHDESRCTLSKFFAMTWDCLYNDGKIHRNCPRCKGMLDD